MADETVTVVVTTFNDSEYLRDALESVYFQDPLPDEVMLVDDGSEENPEPIAASFPRVKFMRQRNSGLSSARNLGLRTARSTFVAFLDADDRFCPGALKAGINCFANRPDASMVYGGHRRIRADGNPLGEDNYRAIGEDAYSSLLAGNCIGMHAAVLYLREALLSFGGFDETLRRCEDYDLYLRFARTHIIASCGRCRVPLAWE